MEIYKEKIQEMFEHYIERKRYNQTGCLPGSHDDTFSAGELHEAEKWLKLFNVDLSHERIQPMVEGEREVEAFDENPALSEATDSDTLRLLVIKYVEEFCKENGYRFRKAYSGRHMFGKNCIGIVCDDPTVIFAKLTAFFSVKNGGTINENVARILEPRTDDMGTERILYFPNCKSKK